MRYGIRHPSLTSGIIEARAYQLEAADEALSGSTMLVPVSYTHLTLPTIYSV